MATSWRANYQRYRELFLNVVAAYQKKQSFKVFVELLLTVAAVTVFSVFALKPTTIAISDLLKEIETKEQLIADMDTKIENVRRAQVVAQQNSQALALLDTALPGAPEPHLLASQIEGTLATSGVQILGISIPEVTLRGEDNRTVRGDPTLEVSLTVAGQFENIRAFLDLLENLRRPVNISSLNINQQNTTDLFTGTSAPLNVSVGATSPYIKNE